MCVSVERIYVHEQVYDRFVDAVVRDVDALKVGSGDGFNYGSLIDQNQLELIERHVDDAKAKGARALSGGKRIPGNGVFYPPTVLVDVDHSMACMTEETFGPTLPIMTVSNESEAIRLANDSPYGLSASLFSGDLQRAKEVAVQLDCGAVNINDAVSNLSCTSAPMGGWKSSASVRVSAEPRGCASFVGWRPLSSRGSSSGPARTTTPPRPGRRHG
jgi:acyl-CoA reductase-like NAD-dependent aldehyde dehydrogenase